jgi:hypothetical protein
MSIGNLPNNLRLGSDGTVFCEDGRDVAEYIREKGTFDFDTLPAPIVIITRESYVRLLTQWESRRQAELIAHGYILAA